MQHYSIKELAKYYGYSERTVHRRLVQLKKNNIFVKNSPGKLFDLQEATRLSEILNFTLKQTK